MDSDSFLQDLSVDFMESEVSDTVVLSSSENEEREAVNAAMERAVAQVWHPPMRRPRQDSAVKNWCFTLNNPEDHKLPDLWHQRVMFCIWQLEKGENGTPHLQGFVQFKDRVRLTTLKQLSSRAHWEKMGKYATVQDNIHYCSKPNEGCECDHCRNAKRLAGPWSYGTPSYTGKRSDLQALAKRAVELGSIQKIAEEIPEVVMKYPKGLQTLLDATTPKPPPLAVGQVVKLYYGPTGTGKTYAAITESAEEETYLKPLGKWWPRYYGEGTVILDDFAGAASEFKLTETLQLLDIYRYQVETKGGYQWLQRKVIIVTTNVHPKQWYKYEGREEHYHALMRRFTEIWVFPYFGRKVQIEGSDLTDFQYNSERWINPRNLPVE